MRLVETSSLEFTEFTQLAKHPCCRFSASQSLSSLLSQFRGIRNYNMPYDASSPVEFPAKPRKMPACQFQLFEFGSRWLLSSCQFLAWASCPITLLRPHS